MSDPNARLPFRQQPYYYFGIKLLVSACAIYLAARILGYL